MKNCTITIFVRPSDLTYLFQVLQILDGLDIDNDYVFNPKDIRFSESMISNFTWVNIDVALFLKFDHCYRKLAGGNNRNSLI